MGWLLDEFFFLLQAVAITCEDTVINLAIKAGFSSKPNRFVKFIGFIWVFAWFAYSLPQWAEKSFLEGTINRLNYSLILGLWRGDWMPIRVMQSRVPSCTLCSLHQQVDNLLVGFFLLFDLFPTSDKPKSSKTKKKTIYLSTK